MSLKGTSLVILNFGIKPDDKKAQRVSSFASFWHSEIFFKFFAPVEPVSFFRDGGSTVFFDTASFLGVGKNFRLLMQSCCFFFSRPFHENFKFLKNCPNDFHEILHSHSTPKGAPACAKTSKSYGWDVRNIAKISPKMAKKQPFFDFFRFSQKLFIRFERNFLQLFDTILESYMCNDIKIVWLGCEKHSQN